MKYEELNPVYQLIIKRLATEITDALIRVDIIKINTPAVSEPSKREELNK